METQNTQQIPIHISTDIYPVFTQIDTEKKPQTASEIQAWLVFYLADLLVIDMDDIDITIPFDHYGLDSSTAIGLTGDLEDWLGYRYDPTLLYDYPTIEALSKHLSK
ncbi:acyl carrier protein [uncultured Nostoc sp.]|uniref:acyl carrier protein n=1 Tax=uncultured Nostoc sp. TaxID=340711 RepID=UPI0035CB66E4